MSTAPAPTPRLSFSIDVVSDVVCPWCYIGKKRLEAAIARTPELNVQVHWRPYQLDPTVPPGGLDRRAYMERKFGSREKIAGIHERITAEGAKEGISFRFDRIARTPNTLDAHRLIRLAGAQGALAQDALVEALFVAFFMEGRDIGDATVLADIAAQSGLDRDAALALLSSDAGAAEVAAGIAQAREVGVTGVPCFILADRLALPGAQDADVIARYMQKLGQKMLEEAAATA